MAGKLVPLVMLPRYSSLAGGYYYTTIPIDVTEYSRAIVTCWRGPIEDELSGSGISFLFQESSDQEIWETCSGNNSDPTPASGDEEVGDVYLKRRWFRLRVYLFGGSPDLQKTVRASCWAVGHLVQREP